MIVDAHHHIWRRADLPWLLGPTRPRIFGPYDAIKRDYLMADFQADLAGTGVCKSVYVQANWAPNWFLDEARWVASVAADTGWPHAQVAFCDMTQDDARPDLDKLARVPLVRGIRHQLHWHENPLYRFATGPDTVALAQVIANASALAGYDFVFELQIFERQIENALVLVEACPDVTFVVQHALMLEDTSEAGLTRWQSALGRLAGRPNAVCKLSGLGTFKRALDPEHIAFVTAEALAAFGPERCLWGSNFPIERLWTSYPALLSAHRAALADHPVEARTAVLSGTAERVYRV